MPFVRRGFRGHYFCACSITLTLVSLSASMALCQAAAPNSTSSNAAATPAAKASDILNPALAQVKDAVGGLNIARWKAPNEVRAATQQNADSIQRDLSGTLPGLLATADAAPASVSAVFPVYRNIDALYDVLLRVWQTANLAAPQNEATNVTGALNKLESARTDLGNAILTASKDSEAEVVKLRADAQKAAAAAQAAAATPPKTTVVNDGPAKTTSTAKRKKKPATTTPADAAPATTPPPATTTPQ
jgi:hypothetical protein